MSNFLPSFFGPKLFYAESEWDQINRFTNHSNAGTWLPRRQTRLWWAHSPIRTSTGQSGAGTRWRSGRRRLGRAPSSPHSRAASSRLFPSHGEPGLRIRFWPAGFWFHSGGLSATVALLSNPAFINLWSAATPGGVRSRRDVTWPFTEGTLNWINLKHSFTVEYVVCADQQNWSAFEKGWETPTLPLARLPLDVYLQGTLYTCRFY